MGIDNTFDLWLRVDGQIDRYDEIRRLLTRMFRDADKSRQSTTAAMGSTYYFAGFGEAPDDPNAWISFWYGDDDGWYDAEWYDYDDGYTYYDADERNNESWPGEGHAQPEEPQTL